jgi:hypothetical protein
MRRPGSGYGLGLSGKKFAGEFRGAGDCEVWDVFVVAVGWSDFESCLCVEASVSPVNSRT